MSPGLAAARAATRSIPLLLVLLLVALPVSITAIDTLLALLIVATLLSLLDPAARARFRLPLGLPIGAFALVTLVSAAAASHPGFALYESKRLASLAAFFVAANGFEGAAAIRRALRWFFGAASVACVYAILQALACSTGMALPAWAGRALRVRLDACQAVVPFRAKAFFSIYMTLGGSLLIALTLLLGILALAGTVSAWLVAPAALALVGLGLTYVRNAWLGLGAAVITLTLLARRLWLIAPVALAVLATLAVPSSLRTRLLSTFDPADESRRERLYFWDAGVRMVADAPLLGLGPGGVRLHYPEYKHPDAVKPRTGHLHNNLVQIAAERGLLGLAAWLWIWIEFFVEAGRIFRALPPGRGDERALVAGSIAAVVGFQVAGLFEYNFGDSEVIDLLLVAMAFPFVCAREQGSPASGPGERKRDQSSRISRRLRNRSGQQGATEYGGE